MDLSTNKLTKIKKKLPFLLTGGMVSVKPFSPSTVGLTRKLLRKRAQVDNWSLSLCWDAVGINGKLKA